MVLGNLDQGLGYADDESVGLAIGLVVVIAKNLLEALRPDQIGQRRNGFAILSQDGSSQAQMFALLTQRGGGKRAFGRLGPLVEEIWLGTKREIGVRVLLEARAELRPLQMLGGVLKEMAVSFVVGQESNFVLASFQTLGTPRTRSRGFGWSVFASSQIKNR